MGDSAVLHSWPDQRECRVGRLCAMPYWILRRPNSPRSLAKSQVLVAKGEEVAGNFKLCCLSVGLSVFLSV